MDSRLSDALDYSGVELRGDLPRQFCDREALQQTRTAPRLSDADYRMALKRFIVSCVDILFYYLDDAGMPVVFLPVRVRQPQPGRWVVGGQRTPFLLLEWSAKELVRIETDLYIDPSRFKALPGDFEYMWAESEHGQGLHARATLLTCELTVDERQDIRLNGEYDSEPGDCWFPLNEALDGTHNIHPALYAMLRAFHDRDRNNGMKLVHKDPRRTVHEMVREFPRGPLVRVTRFEVIAHDAVLGNHYHPRDKYFMVQKGSGTLWMAPAQNRSDVTKRTFMEGDSIPMPGYTAHTFRCEAGTVLVAMTDWKFTKDAVLPAKLV